MFADPQRHGETGGAGVIRREGRLRIVETSLMVCVVPVADDPDTGPIDVPRPGPWPWREFGRMWMFGFALLPKIGRC